MSTNVKRPLLGRAVRPRLKVTVSASILADLDALTATGRFGATAAQTAEQFIRDKVRDYAVEGWIPLRRP
jgi:hypothetical protein